MKQKTSLTMSLDLLAKSYQFERQKFKED